MAHEICKKNGAKTQSKGETTMANSKLNTNEASVAQLQTGRFEHGPL
jgi:hypothetical protein